VRQQLDEAESIFKQAYRQQVLTRIAVGHKVSNADESILPTSSDVAAAHGLDDDDDEDEDLFLAEYRELRLRGSK
jgi:hypothetical protein